MTAEAIAKVLAKPIMIVNYAQLENMWVGETEKNIEAVFQQASEKDAVLFFDEADAVFHRRGMTIAPWTNRDVNVLLNHLENFPGVCILATNLARVMDRALDRRIDIAVEFEMPEPELRKQIWQKLVPPEAPLGKDIDFDVLARKFALSGGFDPERGPSGDAERAEAREAPPDHDGGLRKGCGAGAREVGPHSEGPDGHLEYRPATPGARLRVTHLFGRRLGVGARGGNRTR